MSHTNARTRKSFLLFSNCALRCVESPSPVSVGLNSPPFITYAPCNLLFTKVNWMICLLAALKWDPTKDKMEAFKGHGLQACCWFRPRFSIYFLSLIKVSQTIECVVFYVLAYVLMLTALQSAVVFRLKEVTACRP